MPYRLWPSLIVTLAQTALAPLLGISLTSEPGWAASPPAPTLLYRLETTCSIRGAKAVDCVVEALQDDQATLYRHSIGPVVETIRISDGPLRMARLDPATGAWRSLGSAEAQFSSNTICFDGRDLCVFNPNYLNSVREERVDEFEGRDRVLVRFDGDGRVLLTCYDQGCEALP